MASTSFRDSVNSLGWTRRDPDLPVRTNENSTFLSRLQSYNPFGQGQGYVQLPTHEGPGAPLPAASRREEEDSLFACKCPPFSAPHPAHDHLLDGPFYSYWLHNLVQVNRRRRGTLFLRWVGVVEKEKKRVKKKKKSCIADHSR